MTANKTRIGSGDFARRIRFEQSGNIFATYVQEAIEELDAEKQGLDVGLTDISGLTPTDGNVIVRDGSNWVAENGAEAGASLKHVSRKWTPVSGKKTCFNKELERWRESE